MLIYLIYNDVLKINGKATPYIISTEGKIYNHKGKQLKPRINNSGYLVIDLYIEPKVKKTVLVHRAVAETFIPNPCNKATVNHKDGNKLNPCYYNLEWSTYSENNSHAVDTNLRKPLSCGSHQFASFTNEQVHEICKLLEKGHLYSDIANMLSLTDIPNVESKIKMIKTGNSWKDISRYYSIPKSKNKLRVYSDELIHQICKLFSEGFTREQVIVYLDLENTLNIKKLLYSIYTKRKYKYITDKYDW